MFYLVSLALDPGERKNDRLPSKHLLVELVAAVLNGWVEVNHLISDPQLMNHILRIKEVRRFKSSDQICKQVSPPLVVYIVYLNLGVPSRFVADLWSFSVHVHISFVLHLSSEHLGPGFETGLKTHAQDAFNLKKISSTISLKTK